MATPPSSVALDQVGLLGSSSGLEVEVRHDGPHVRVVASGSLVVRTARSLRSQVEALAQVEGEVVVDLRAVRELDAAGLLAATSPVMGLRRAGQRARIEAPVEAVAGRMVRLTGVIDLLAC